MFNEFVRHANNSRDKLYILSRDVGLVLDDQAEIQEKTSEQTIVSQK